MPDKTALLIVAALLLALYLWPGGQVGPTGAVLPAQPPPQAPGGTSGVVQPATVIGSIDGARCGPGAKLDPSGTQCVPLCGPGTSYDGAGGCRTIVPV